MTLSYIVNSATICDLAAILLAAGFLLYYRLSGHKLSSRPFFSAIFPVLFVMALSDLIIRSPLLFEINNSLFLTNLGYGIFYLSFNLLTVLLLMDLLAETGRKEAVRRFRLLIWLPFVIGCLTLAVRLFQNYRLSRFEIFDLRYGGGKWLLLFYFIPAFFLIISLVLLWQKNRRLVLFFIILLLNWMILIQNYRQVSLGPLLAALSLILYYILPEKRGILIEIGSILVLLMLMVVSIVDNYVSASAFSSRIESLNELETAYLKEINTLLSGISAWPWFVDYWFDHPDSIKPGDVTLKAIDNRMKPVIRELGKDPEDGLGLDIILELSPEEASSLSEESQQVVANVFYDYLNRYMQDIYSSNYLLDLMIVKPLDEDSAEILFDIMSASDETYGLGTVIGIAYLKDSLVNSEQASDWLSDWRWREAEDKGYLGYNIDIEGGLSGGTLMLTSILPLEEALKPLSYMLSFRFRATVYMFLIAFIILLLLYTNVLKPITWLRKSIVSYQKDKDAKAVRKSLASLKSENEIGDMAAQFTELAAEMDHYTNEIVEMAEAQEQIHTELMLATNIQRNALSTDFPDEPAFSLFASMTPAREVGGDFYDFIRIDEDHLALVIADVSGKGIPAALFMMSVKIMISDRALTGGSPAEILTAVNEQIQKNNSLTNMFVTVWLGILDLRTGKMTCSSAGHEYPFLRGEDGHFILFRDKHGLVIGAMEGIRYKNYQIDLSPGDAVFVYTDGVPEACTASGAFFGTERLGSTLYGISPDETAEGILRTVRESVDKFTAGSEQFDDLTMLCLIYHGPQKTS